VHIPSPCKRLSRSLSTMNVSDSLHTLSSPRLCLLSLPAFTGVCRVSLVPDNTLFTCHAQSPRWTLRTSPYRFRMVLQVLTSTPLKVSSPTIGTNGVAYSFRNHISLWPAKFPVYTSYVSFCKYSVGATLVERNRLVCYLLISKTRYWWMVNPSR
jgi:hypothetical protein